MHQQIGDLIMKKSLFALSILGFSAMADNSACLTSACDSNEVPSSYCVSSNNLRTVGVMKNDCTPAVAESSSGVSLYKDDAGVTHYSKKDICTGKEEVGVAWADVRNPSEFADKSLNGAVCTGAQCQTVCG
jgi:hypothetical protein